MGAQKYRLRRQFDINQRHQWFNSGSVTEERIERDLIFQLLQDIPLTELKKIISVDVLEPFDDNIESAIECGNEDLHERLIGLRHKNLIEYNLEIKL